MNLTLKELARGCCPCGARLGHGQRRCGKCSARSRYQLRQIQRKKAARRRCARRRPGRA
jgi:hypothetical protein